MKTMTVMGVVKSVSPRPEQRQLALELHRPKRRRFLTRPVEVKGINETWQADLVEMQHLRKWNHGFRYLLTVIDVVSKKAYARPCTTKKAGDVTEAMGAILSEAGRAPKHLQTDQGTEFFNKSFRALMKKHNVNHYHSYSQHKASIVERFNRTLKTNMYRYFTQQNTVNWSDAIDQLVSEYNNTIHRTIRMKPAQVTRKHQVKVLQNIRNARDKRLKAVRKPLFREGDLVRLSRSKHVFEKGFTPNWTEELFKVSEILMTRPRTYRVVDMLNEPIQGTFYDLELQKTVIPQYTRVEKILARKLRSDGTRMIRVKWKGYDSRFNQWIPLKESIKL